MGLFDRLSGRTRAGARLAALVADYPPYVAPVSRAPASLTRAEADANLAHLLLRRPERLDRFARLLAGFGLDLRAGLAATSPEPFLDRLWRWTLDTWPAIHDPALAAHHARLGKRGGDPVFGLLTDTALALGEMVLARAPDWRWALDLDPANRRMASWRQPCVIGGHVIGSGAMAGTVFHAEHVVDGAYAGCLRGGYLTENLLAQSVLDCLRAGLPSGAARLAGPAPERRTTLYDRASDHRGGGDGAGTGRGGGHLALFVAWAARHGLLAPALDRQAAGLRDGSAMPMRWLDAHTDGCLSEADLTDDGNRFARIYYGTPAGGLHDRPGSYLHDLNALLAPDGDTASVPADWATYAAIAPTLDDRHAAFLGDAARMV